MNIEKIKTWIYSHKKTSIFVGIILFTQIVNLINPIQPAKKNEEVAVATTTPTVVVEKTLEEKVTEAITNKLGEKTNMSKPRVLGVEISKLQKGNLQVLVKVNTSENLTTSLQKGTANSEATKISQNVFPVDEKIQELVIWSYVPTVDKYGNSKDGVGLIYSISRDLYKKINWGNFQHNSFPDLLRSEGRADDRNSYIERIKF